MNYFVKYVVLTAFCFVFIFQNHCNSQSHTNQLQSVSTPQNVTIERIADLNNQISKNIKTLKDFGLANASILAVIFSISFVQSLLAIIEKRLLAGRCCS